VHVPENHIHLRFLNSARLLRRFSIQSSIIKGTVMKLISDALTLFIIAALAE
jgi:hypothetical protein